MTILEQVCAGSDPSNMVVDTVELYAPSWPGRQFLVQGYSDFIAAIETGVYVTFKAAPLTISLPKRANSASQVLSFAIDNVTGEAQRLFDLSLEAEEHITLTFRRYLLSDPSGPAERGFVITILQGKMVNTTLSVSAGFMNLLDYEFPRDNYDLNNAPALAYL